MSEIKMALDGINSRLIIEEEKLMNVKTQQQKLMKMKHREKQDLKSEQSISELWDYFKWPNMCVSGVPKGEERKGDIKNFEKIMVENFSNLMKTMSNIQEA